MSLAYGSFLSRCAYGSTVTCVAAVDREYFKVDSSNYGPAVKITAPGHQIESADYQRPNGHVAKTGTSQAAAHVSGIYATFISWEALHSDPEKGRQRLEENKLHDLIELFPRDPRTPDGFANNGIRLSVGRGPYCKSFFYLVISILSISITCRFESDGFECMR
jgi:hypothetical protein